MAATIDIRAAADHVELSIRWMSVWLGVPEQPDSYWDEVSAVLTAELSEYAATCLNACAVMADCSPMTLEES